MKHKLTQLVCSGCGAVLSVQQTDDGKWVLGCVQCMITYVVEGVDMNTVMDRWFETKDQHNPKVVEVLKEHPRPSMIKYVPKKALFDEPPPNEIDGVPVPPHLTCEWVRVRVLEDEEVKENPRTSPLLPERRTCPTEPSHQT